MFNGNQSTDSTKTDVSSQGMDQLIPEPTDNQTLQHEDHSNKVSGIDILNELYKILAVV